MKHQDIFLDYQLLFTALFESTQQGNVLIQNDLQVKLFNTQAHEMFARVSDTGLRTACNILELVPDAIRDKVLQLILTAQSTHEISKEAVEMTTLVGDKVYYELCITPVKPMLGGQIAYLSLGIIDLTQMRQRAQEVFQKNEMLASLLDSNSTYLIRTNMEGKYTYVNGAFCNKFGQTEAQVLGKYYAPTVHPDDLAECEKATHAAISEPGKVVTFEIRKPNPAGGYFHTEWEFVTISDSTGQIVEVQGVGRDISSYKHTQKQLEEERKQLELTIWSGRLGTWDWDVPTGVVKINDYWAEMLGYEHHEIAEDLAAWEARVHPDDLSLALKALNEHLAGHTLYYESEHRMKNKADEWVWILDTGKVIARDSKGKPLRVIGIHQDISARKQAEEEARLSQETNKSVFATMQEGIVIHEMNGAIMLCNQSSENILGLTYDQMIGRKSIDPRWRSIKADGSPFAGEDHPAMVTLRTGVPQHNVIMGVHKPDGQLTWISINSQLLYQLDTHNPYAVYAVFHDITERKQAEDKLQASQIKLKAILDSTTDSNILISPEMKILSFNRIAQLYVQKYQGRELKEGNSILDYIVKDTEDTFKQYILNALQGQIVKIEQEISFNDTLKVWFEICYYAVHDHNKNLIGISFNSTNIDQRKRTELALQESEQRYRKVVETQTDFVLLSTADTTITFANHALRKALGVSLEQIVGQKWINFALPEDIQETLYKITQLSPNDSNFITENRDNRANGEIGWTQWVNQGVFDEEGKLIQIQSVGRDITEIRQAEITLQENDRFLSNLIDNLPGYVYRANNDEDFTPIYLSPQVQEVTGYSVSEYLTEKVSSCGHEIHAKDKSMVIEIVQKALKARQTYMCEYRIITKGGQEKWVWKRGKGVFDDKGELLYLEGFVMDITQNKENERQRTALFRRLQNIARHLPGFIYQYCLRPDGTSFFEYASEGIERLFGKKAETFSTDASEAFATVHPDDLHKLQESIANSAKNLTEWHHEWRSIVDGETMWLQGTASPLLQKNGNIMWYGYINDISQYKMMETELFRLALVAKRTSNLVVIADAQRNIVWVNDAFVNLTGYSLKDVYGRNSSSFLQFDETNPETILLIREKLNANEPVRCEILNKGKDGKKYWLDVEIQPLFDEKRVLTGFIAIEADITERKIAEEKIRKQNEILREITFTQAHTLRRPIANILGLVQLLELDKDKGMDTISKYLDYIAASAKETDMVIRQIIDKTSEID